MYSLLILRKLELDLIVWTYLCGSVYVLCNTLDIENFMTVLSGKNNDYDSYNTIIAATVTTNCACHTCKLP